MFVLVAADREQGAEALVLTLGCEVATTVVGSEAVDLAVLARPDAVVLLLAEPDWETMLATIADRAAWRRPLAVARTGGGETAVPGAHTALERPGHPDVLAGLVCRFRELLAGIDGFDPAA